MVDMVVALDPLSSKSNIMDHYLDMVHNSKALSTPM